MKLQKIVPVLLAFIMLVPALCFTSCSQNEPTPTIYELALKAEEAGFYFTPEDLFRPTDSAMEDRAFIAPWGEIIIFKDEKSAKLYEKILENQRTEQINSILYLIDQGKYQREYSRDAGEWAMHDQAITDYGLSVESHREMKIERKGRIIFYGFPEFVDALAGTSSFDFGSEARSDIAYYIDDIEYEIAKIYFELAPEDILDWIYSNAMYNFNGVVVDTNERDVTTATLENAKIAKYQTKRLKRECKQENELYPLEIDYYEYMLSTFADDMSEEEIASTEQKLAHAREGLDVVDSRVIFRYDNMVIYGDPFYTIITWLSHMPVIGSLFELLL